MTSALEEGLEEILQYPLDALSKKITYAPDTPWFSTTDSAVINPLQMLESGAVGGVAGGLFGGGASVISDIQTGSVENSSEGQQISDPLTTIANQMAEKAIPIPNQNLSDVERDTPYIQDVQQTLSMPENTINQSRTYTSKETNKQYVIPKMDDIKYSENNGTIVVDTDYLSNVDPKDERAFIKTFALYNYVTQFDERGNVIGEPHPVTIKDDGLELLITKLGINDVAKKIRGSKDKGFVNSMLVLPQLIEGSKYVDSSRDSKGNLRAQWKHYENRFIYDGKEYRAKIRIKEIPAGNRYYYHSLDNIEIDSSNSPLGTTPLQTILHEESISNNSVPQNSGNIQSNMENHTPMGNAKSLPLTSETTGPKFSNESIPQPEGKIQVVTKNGEGNKTNKTITPEANKSITGHEDVMPETKPVGNVPEQFLDRKLLFYI